MRKSFCSAAPMAFTKVLQTLACAKAAFPDIDWEYQPECSAIFLQLRFQSSRPKLCLSYLEELSREKFNLRSVQ